MNISHTRRDARDKVCINPEHDQYSNYVMQLKKYVWTEQLGSNTWTVLQNRGDESLKKGQVLLEEEILNV
jgi:hypothetical protein